MNILEETVKLLREEFDYKNLEVKVDNSEHDVETVEWFKEQIQKGIHEPILINADNEVLDGNHRLKAYQELEIEPPLLYRGERKDFYNTAKEANYDGIKIIKLMIEYGTAEKIN